MTGLATCCVNGRIWFSIGPAVCWKRGRRARRAGAVAFAPGISFFNAGPDCSARLLALVRAPFASLSVPGSSLTALRIDACSLANEASTASEESTKLTRS